jgi:hypothetical protein
MVAATVAHVACGALVLVTTVILTIQIHRHTDFTRVQQILVSPERTPNPATGNSVHA